MPEKDEPVRTMAVASINHIRSRKKGVQGWIRWDHWFRECELCHPGLSDPRASIGRRVSDALPRQVLAVEWGRLISQKKGGVE